MEYSEILHRCFRCGYCKLPGSYIDLNCPSYLKYRFETYSPGGRMWLLRAWLNGEIKTSPRLAEIMYSCASCANCVEHCTFPKFKDDLLHAFIAGRQELVNEGKIPPTVRDYLKAMQAPGNPYKLPDSDRLAWAVDLDVAPYKDQEYLYYVGDVGTFDERAQKMARAVARLLGDLKVSFGILGKDERSDGNEVRVLGEKLLFQHLAERNLGSFRERNITKIVTLSPHAYHVFKNEYPAGVPEVYHYTQILADRAGRASMKKKNGPLKVTFHDPCYLGRHNDEYRAPRNFLRSVSGVILTEMPRSKSDALCCGGGGGNFFTDVLGGGPDAPARVRVREALDTGAEVLLVACPNCVKMLEDAVKAEFAEDKLQVCDLAELVTHG
jgi:Fe-S oxidoreductase